MDRETLRPNDDGLEDVQSLEDRRRLALDAVGIRDLRHPIVVSDGGIEQHTVATVSLAVELPPERRGAHLSRFTALLNEWSAPLSQATLPDFLGAMAARLDAHSAQAEFCFPFFLRKHAPVSGGASLMDYELRWMARLRGGRASIETCVSVPVTSLCPCSREISRYGAHNQRARVRASVRDAKDVTIAELVAIVESEASAPVYALLKRSDEKYLTERAYENAKFVEDTVRDLALRLREDPRIGEFRVEAENFESIHNHSAWAVISS